jgi:Holliday junction DNA helicase RuvB
MEKILSRSATIIDLKIDNESVGILAKRSRRTPRIANRLLKRVGDFALVYNEGQITKEVTEDSLQRIGIDDRGLDDSDRRYIETLLDKFEGGPVGVATMSASSGIERNTIEEVIEPYLLQMGLIKRTPKGRVASSRLFELYGIKNRQSLFDQDGSHN